MKKLVGIAIIIFFSVISFGTLAQISSGGIPASFGLEGVLANVKSIAFQAPDMDQIKKEDTERDGLFLPRRFSVLLPAGIDFLSSGTWLQSHDGTRICLLKMEAFGALASNLYFDQFYLPQGASLFLYDESRNQIKGAYTIKNNRNSGTFACELMHGSVVILELNLPAEAIDNPVVHISEFGYAYRDVPLYDEVKGFGGSDWCEININCSPEGDNWQMQKRGVVRILVEVSGGGFWCTGSLVNNVRYDATPYVLTADHCAFQLNQYASQEDLGNWLFYFRYESETCDNPDTEPALFSLLGATKVAQGGKRGQEGSDFYLVKMIDPIPSNFNPYFLGWSRIDEESESGVTIHHPEGDIKKISSYLTPVESSGWFGNGLQSHWKVIWGETENGWGVTESGSSGSPLFNNDGLLIGTLTGGLASCDENGKPDYYGKFSYHWQSNGDTDTAQLKPWLDPDDTGVYSIGGYTLDVDEQKIVNNFDINLFPNPASKYFFINFTSLKTKSIQLSIYDIVGSLLKELHFEYNGSEVRVVVDDMPKGVCFITIRYDQNIRVKKLVIQ